MCRAILTQENNNVQRFTTLHRFRVNCLFQLSTLTHLYILLNGFLFIIAVSVLAVQIYLVYRYFR